MLDTITSKADSTSAILTASAMEFYMSSCLDLLEEGVVDGANGSVSSSNGAAGGASGGGGTAACHIGSDHTPIGLMSVPIDSEQACLAFMSRVRERRHTRATLMNAASDGHHGSSRSHCAMILTLRQLDRASGNVRTTNLHVIVRRLVSRSLDLRILGHFAYFSHIPLLLTQGLTHRNPIIETPPPQDMAGAERPKSVQSTQLAMWDAHDGKEVSSMPSPALNPRHPPVSPLLRCSSDGITSHGLAFDSRGRCARWHLPRGSRRAGADHQL